MSITQPKTIGDIAKDANAKPPKPPTIGSKIHSKWIAQVEKFVGAEVFVRAGPERVYAGQLVAFDVNYNHVILRIHDEIVLIRNPWTISRMSRHAPARSSARDLAGESQTTPETTAGGSR